MYATCRSENDKLLWITTGWRCWQMGHTAAAQLTGSNYSSQHIKLGQKLFYMSILIVMPQYTVSTILPGATLEKGIKMKCYKLAVSFPPGQTQCMSLGISPNQTFCLENCSHFNRYYPIEIICYLFSILSTIQQQESGLIRRIPVLLKTCEQPEMFFLPSG